MTSLSLLNMHKSNDILYVASSSRVVMICLLPLINLFDLFQPFQPHFELAENVDQLNQQKKAVSNTTRKS